MNIQLSSPNVAVDTASLRRCFGAFASGVTVVTAGGESPHGMTANSFTTVSLEPPLILVCVGREAVMHRVLSDAATFAVSVLSAGQRDIARYFADKSRPLGLSQFESVQWVPGKMSGAPLISGALAHFECELTDAYAGGDHSIFVGRLLSLARREDDGALLYLNGKFRRVGNRRRG